MRYWLPEWLKSVWQVQTALATFFLCLASTAASRLANMSRLPRVYRSLCPHSRAITAAAIPIPAELPQSHPHYRGKHRGITAIPIPVSIFSQLGMVWWCSGV